MLLSGEVRGSQEVLYTLRGWHGSRRWRSGVRDRQGTHSKLCEHGTSVAMHARDATAQSDAHWGVAKYNPRFMEECELLTVPGVGKVPQRCSEQHSAAWRTVCPACPAECSSNAPPPWFRRQIGRASTSSSAFVGLAVWIPAHDYGPVDVRGTSVGLRLLCPVVELGAPLRAACIAGYPAFVNANVLAGGPYHGCYDCSHCSSDLSRLHPSLPHVSCLDAPSEEPGTSPDASRPHRREVPNHHTPLWFMHAI